MLEVWKLVSDYRLPLLTRSQFLAHPLGALGDALGIVLTSENLVMFNFTAPLSALRAARTHVATDKDVRFYLRGVCFNFRAGRIYATDGHRLFVCTGPKADHDNVIIPTETLDAAFKQFTGDYGRGKLLGSADVSLSVDGRTITVETPVGFLSGSAIDGTFPDVSRVVPKDAGPCITSGFNGRYLADASEALAIYHNAPAKANRGVLVHSRGTESAIITDGKDGALVIVMPMRGEDGLGTAQRALEWFHDAPAVSGMASAAA
jgi:hypothetical protein